MAKVELLKSLVSQTRLCFTYEIHIPFTCYLRHCFTSCCSVQVASHTVQTRMWFSTCFTTGLRNRYAKYSYNKVSRQFWQIRTRNKLTTRVQSKNTYGCF